MSQMSLFDARLARDAALASVEGNSPEWIERALAALAALPAGVKGIGEDFRQIIEPKVGRPHHPNAWGALVNTARRRGILVPTGEFAQMKLKRSHARISRVYRRAA